ncbi:protein fem-1 homolog CG6966-like [Toxorhynchites rutilus septentrionalis]|uniref:protein fem-1 homolog CG6966-like n=1 Tax=Toxorhynchites rutilus septentrionalis TaxID=329112 RepID=UPI002479F7EA|nr:protein fem-1 homolog CG6966-like [Toxorhynchites rutilus septentrionalis]
MSVHIEEFMSYTSATLFVGIISPTEHLSEELREIVQSLPRSIRKKVVETTMAGSTSLVKACVIGNLKIIEYLVKVCGADIEQKSTCPRRCKFNPNSYTPLGWACRYGNFHVLECLIQLGADINGVSDCGSTPLLIACQRRNVEIVKYLVLKGADVRKAKNDGETCFFAWLKSCSFEPNNQEVEIIQLLLKHGADPLVSYKGDDSLRFLCRNGNYKIALCLMNFFDYSPERKADTYELMGAIIYFRHYKRLLAIQCWRKALDIRMNAGNYIAKRPENPPQSIYGDAREFTTIIELEAITYDLDAIGIQSLMICERILGIDDNDTLSHMTRFGFFYQKTHRIDQKL